MDFTNQCIIWQDRREKRLKDRKETCMHEGLFTFRPCESASFSVSAWCCWFHCLTQTWGRGYGSLRLSQSHWAEPNPPPHRKQVTPADVSLKKKKVWLVQYTTYRVEYLEDTKKLLFRKIKKHNLSEDLPALCLRFWAALWVWVLSASFFRSPPAVWGAAVSPSSLLYWPPAVVWSPPGDKHSSNILAFNMKTFK